MSSVLEVGMFYVGLLVFIVLSLHGCYVAIMHVTGKKKWFKHGEHVALTLVCSIWMVFILFSYVVGWVVVNIL